MTKQLIKIFAVLCCIVTLTVIGNAGTGIRRVFEIPFDFIVKNQTYPAGQYTVERLSPANPDFLVLKQIGGKVKTIFLRRNASDLKKKDQFQLIFIRSAASYVLTGISAFGEKYAQMVAPNRTEPKLPEDTESWCYVLNPDVGNAI